MLLRYQIDKLKQRILTLSAIVEESVRKAIESAQKRDAKLAGEVIEEDAEIDRMEVDVEEECLKILALYQPVALDLRFIIAVLKINNDLERIGDYAVNIAERTAFLSSEVSVEFPPNLSHMVTKVRSMLRRSLDSLINVDANSARQVLELDDEVDDMHRRMYADVQNRMQAQPGLVKGLTQLLSISRYLERIADLATNIAEDVIYMIEGEIVRHGGQGSQRPKRPGTPKE